MRDTKGDSIRAIVEQLRKAHEGKDPNEHVGIRRWEFGRLADRIEAASERIREQCAEIETIKIMMRKGIRERADAESKHKAGMEMNERLHVRMRALKRELDLRRAASGACRHGGDAGQGGRKPPVQRPLHQPAEYPDLKVTYSVDLTPDDPED